MHACRVNELHPKLLRMCGGFWDHFDFHSTVLLVMGTFTPIYMVMGVLDMGLCFEACLHVQVATSMDSASNNLNGESHGGARGVSSL